MSELGADIARLEAELDKIRDENLRLQNQVDQLNRKVQLEAQLKAVVAQNAELKRTRDRNMRQQGIEHDALPGGPSE